MASLPNPDACQLCARELPLTFHHLIPRTLHSNKWFKRNFSREQMREGAYLCRDCHGAVHRFIDEKQLGKAFNTLELLSQHPQVARFASWVAGRAGRFKSR